MKKFLLPLTVVAFLVGCGNNPLDNDGLKDGVENNTRR